jgi:hypothetical protein
MRKAAAPKSAGNSAGQSLFKAISILGASVCLTLFLASPGLAQRGSHGGGSHGGGASHGGGFSGGSHGTGFGATGHSGGALGGGVHTGGPGASGPVPRVAIGEGPRGSGASGRMPSGMATGYAGSANSGAGFVNRTATAPTTGAMPSGAGSGLRLIFVDDSGRVVSSPGDPPVGSYLWGGPKQQQQGRPAAPPPAPRPAPMPVAPMMRPPVMQAPISPGPMLRPPIMPVPIQRMPVGPRPIPLPGANPNPHPVPLPPTKGRPSFLPIVPMQSRPMIFMRGGKRSLLPVTPQRGYVGMTGTPLPLPPQMKKIVLEPGIGANPSSSTGYMATPIPPNFCIQSLGDCGIGFQRQFFDNDFDDFGFNFGFGGPLFFAFGGPFGFGGPCLFDGFFLNCIGTGWNGPFGWGWGTPWGYNPGSGSLYPIGGYMEPTGSEMNQASVNDLGPGTFLAPEPVQPTLGPTEAPAQPVAILVLKDGTEFGVTSYWLQDNRLFYVTTYNIQSSIPIDELDLQATVDLNYKRGVTFTLTPKPEEQPQPQE